MSRHRSDVVGCAQPSERSARRIAQPIPSVLASDATPRCASMASADRQMIGDATLGPRPRRRSGAAARARAMRVQQAAVPKWERRDDAVTNMSVGAPREHVDAPGGGLKLVAVVS
ncbi:hypothetical protein [Verminephrobacter eiseniae]|uniref:Uncharacterized protein n=2 Tax=Verminephrobacter eiseniae TaxID=364317 RepID=A1WG84_VEREI|nr:hypothetical protein [Verminephrobacter eiseniae]ABM56641.1 hypothetical protein Veis_0862 [Verminephrobacter eiseniae EF01-2]